MIDLEELLALIQSRNNPTQQGVKTPSAMDVVNGLSTLSTSIGGLSSSGQGALQQGAGTIASGAGSGTSALKSGGGSGAGFVSAGTQLASNLLTPVFQGDDGIVNSAESKTLGALKGAGTGAAIGSVIPGVGTAIGAGAGAIVGGLFGKSNKGAIMEERREKYGNVLDTLQSSSQGHDNAYAYNSNGYKTPSYFMKLGGNTPSQYKVEDNEVLVTPPGTPPPRTDRYGRATRIAPNTYKFSGATHEAGSGGIGVAGGEGGFVFSDTLKTDSRKYKI